MTFSNIKFTNNAAHIALHTTYSVQLDHLNLDISSKNVWEGAFAHKNSPIDKNVFFCPQGIQVALEFLIPRLHSLSCQHTHVVERAAAGWGDLEEAWVDEGSERRGRLVFGHGVAV